jgi:hypothetical protein
MKVLQCLVHSSGRAVSLALSGVRIRQDPPWQNLKAWHDATGCQYASEDSEYGQCY